MTRRVTWLAAAGALLSAQLVARSVAAQPAGAHDPMTAEVLAHSSGEVTLYRGAASQGDFAVQPLQPPSDEQDLVRAVASRLTSRSAKVGGLSACPHAAGCFALGVADKDPETVRVFGADEGYLGLVRARTMQGKDFAALLAKHGASPRGLARLLQTLGRHHVVLEAEGAVEALAQRHPGVLTAGFRRMIAGALGREAEYLVFGSTPQFQQVVAVRKQDVIDSQSAPRARFNPELSRVVRRPPPARTSPPATAASSLVQQPAAQGSGASGSAAPTTAGAGTQTSAGSRSGARSPRWRKLRSGWPRRRQ